MQASFNDTTTRHFGGSSRLGWVHRGLADGLTKILGVYEMIRALCLESVGACGVLKQFGAP